MQATWGRRHEPHSARAQELSGSAFRSWVVALCALLVAGFALGTTFILRGAESSLRLAIEQLGADIVVVPEGTETRVESALSADEQPTHREED